MAKRRAFHTEELFIGRSQLDAPLTELPWRTLTTGEQVQVLGMWVDDRVHVLSDHFPTGEGFVTKEILPQDESFAGPVG